MTSTTTPINHDTFLRVIIVMCLGCLLMACQGLPTSPHLAKSIALTKSVHTLYQTHTPSTLSTLFTAPANTDTQSGYYPIATGADALVSRVIFSEHAKHSIDVQYYIWHNDAMGKLMLQDLWMAAERGVKVRLLLDDFNGSSDLDGVLTSFARHPNIAVRLVNPATYRSWRSLNYLRHPIITNRRMHNKSMTFDRQVSLLGGRNIGNEYLGGTPHEFADSDVLVVGSAVADITRSFEEYWNAATSYDIETLNISTRHKHSFDFSAYAHNVSDSPAYQAIAAQTELDTLLLNQTLPLRWGRVRFLADNANKLKGDSAFEDHLISALQEEIGSPKHTLNIISSYFVPSAQGVKVLTDLAKSGVQINILTNSLESTDVISVQAGYGHWRKTLLASGIRLFETKSHAPRADNTNHPTHKTSLHAKVFAIDDAKVFIGSYNIDPRSAHINSELGVVIDDGDLARQLRLGFSTDKILTHAYEVKLDGNQLQWHTLESGNLVIFYQEAHANPIKQAGIGILATTPIDGLL